MSKHVFVSHSHKDSAVADSVVTALERRGVSCWMAPRDVSPGGSYAESILTAIETASCFVLIYSEHSNVSSHVLREVERALTFGVNIVPVRFDDSTPSKSLDYLLATVHWLAIPAESRERSIAKATEQIAEWLTNFLNNPAAPLPVRPKPFQMPLVTPLETPPRKSRKLLIETTIALVLIGAGIFVTGRVPYFKTPGQNGGTKMDTNTPSVTAAAGSATTIAPLSITANRPLTAKPGRAIGYAGVPQGSRSTALPNTNNILTNRPRTTFADRQMENTNGMPAPPPPPPQYGNRPGLGAPPDGRYPPPPPPPPDGRPMFGPGRGPGPGMGPDTSRP